MPSIYPANDLERAKLAIAKIESGGDYNARGPATGKGQRAYGKYQVMDFNIPSWTKEALGQSLTPDQFLNNPRAQEKVFEHKFGQYISQYGGYENAAKVWFGGPGALKNADAKDILGTTVNDYTKRFSEAFGGQGFNAAAGSLPQQPSSNLSSFAATLDEAVNLARQKRNTLSLSLMAPFQGTVAASDFNGILGGLNKASDTSTQDLIKNAGLDIETRAKEDELLSVTEAQTLGVPYGTTKREAAGKAITPVNQEKDPKEYQYKANLFVQRLSDADKTLTGNQADVVASNPLLYSAQSMAENTTLGNATVVPPLVQTQRQAERNFLNAVLRRESGAVISPSEFSEGAKQYFPRPGDSDEVLAQKAKNRAVVIQSLQQEAGPAFKSQSSATTFTGTTQSGIRYTVEP